MGIPARFTMISADVWGVALVGDHRQKTDNTKGPGDWVLVAKRSGKTDSCQLGAVVTYRSESNETVFHIAARRRNGSAPRSAPKSTPTPEWTYPKPTPRATDDAKREPIPADAPPQVRAPSTIEDVMAALVKAQAEADAIPAVVGAHRDVPALIRRIKAGVKPLLVGPAGSGKTSAVRAAAEALGLPFFFSGAVADRFQLFGFENATGKIVETQFSMAVSQPSVVLLDELDASAADALLAVNAVIDNRIADLPRGAVAVHDECRFVATANTFGRGADRVYVGRNPLDGATLDRFVTVEWTYDEEIEKRIGAANLGWVEMVQRIRAAVEKLAVRHIISTRAIRDGIALLSAGFSVPQVLDETVWKGLDKAARAKVERAVVEALQ